MFTSGGIRQLGKRVGIALSLTLLSTTVMTAISMTPASAAATRFTLAISPAIGPAGTRVDLSATGASPASGTVEFTLINAAGTSTDLGSADVSKSGAALLRVRLNDEGIVKAEHKFVAAGQPTSSVGGTNFRFGTTSPSTVAVDVSSRGYYNAPETTLGLSYSVWAYQYRVTPTAPNRSFSDFVVSCDGSPAVELPDGTALTDVCVATAAGQHHATVSDSFGQYRPASFDWTSVDPIRKTLAIGDQLVFAIPAGSTLVPSTLAVPCVDGVCTYTAGSLTNPGITPVLEAFAFAYSINGNPYWVAQQFVVTIDSPSTGGLTITAPPTGVSGKPFPVTVSGASPSLGRIDLAIDGVDIGSAWVSPMRETVLTARNRPSWSTNRACGSNSRMKSLLTRRSDGRSRDRAGSVVRSWPTRRGIAQVGPRGRRPHRSRP